MNAAKVDASISLGPVFIVGMNGSGTTLVLDLLNNHPDLYGFPRETRLIPYFINRLKKYGDLSQDDNFFKLWNDVRKMPQLCLENGGNPPPVPEDFADMPHNLETIIDSIFRYFAREQGKVRWCEKTPMHVMHITSLNRVFPNARFVHVIRDGRACAASFHRRWENRPEKTIFLWKRAVRKGREEGTILGNRYYELRYEELTADAEKVMNGLCDFLRVSFDEGVLSPSRVRGFTGCKAKEVLPDPQRWRHYFSKEVLIRLEQIAGKALHELGYKTAFPKSDVDPSYLRVWYWSEADNIRRGFKIVGDELFHKNRRRGWKVRAWTILTAIRQRSVRR